MTQLQRARGAVPRVERPNLWQRIWQPFWVLPLAIVVLAVAVATFLPALDKSLGERTAFVIQSGPDGARSVLSTIASAMISVTGLVFSVTMVVLQLASSQYSPRLMSGFLKSRTTQATLGIFAASFVYALLVMRAVRGSNADGDSFVPQLSVALAVLIVLAAVAMFIAFIHHIVTSIQVGVVVSRIGSTTAELIREQFGDPAESEETSPSGFGPTWSPRPGESSFPVTARGKHGRLSYIDFQSLVDLAREHGVVIDVQRDLGAPVAEGQVLATVWGDVPGDALARSVLANIGIARDRSMMQDVGFGFRQLVDIAERALSPGVNDPTTAVQAVDELHNLLRLLAVRPTISPYVADDDGAVRVVHRPTSFEALLSMAVDEVGYYGRTGMQVPGRLLGMLDDLSTVARPEFRRHIEGRRELVLAWSAEPGAPPLS